jgi:hypothetical protein
MTVIATIITSHYTVHASDSFITERQPDGSLVVKESQQTKLVRVDAWRGAMAYWGVASYQNWNTIDWLRAKANSAGTYGSPQNFAEALASELTVEVSARSRAVKKGIGIHFTAYERVDGYWVPELFLISNWTDLSYVSCRTAFTATRETYGTYKQIEERSSEHGNRAHRLEVHSALQNDAALFHYNNGDTLLFNSVAKGIFSSFSLLMQRGQVADHASVRTHLSLARRPVEVASKLLSDLARKESIVIGGKAHDIAISPNGEYHSTTGD